MGGIVNMQNQPVDNGAVQLLWTGGWDSTFRLLSLLLHQQRSVQPYYLIDTQRRSFATEIIAMKDVKQQLGAKYGNLGRLLLPIVFREVNDIPPDNEITASYDRICSESHVGIQYEWGARFAHAEGLSNLELSLIGGGHMHKILEPYLARRQDGTDVVIEIDRKHQGSDVYRVFKDYRFPLIELTKWDMRVIARDHGFEDLMLLTRFCHRPRSNGKPCGVCIPCTVAMECDFGWRLPKSSRARFRFRQLYLKGRGRLEKCPRVFPTVQGLARRVKGVIRRATP